MNVAVPGPSFPLQHSPIFGQLASSHTVCRSLSRNVCFIPVNSSPVGSVLRSQSGFRERLILTASGAKVYNVARHGDGIAFELRGLTLSHE
jgi:hypothetical protein